MLSYYRKKELKCAYARTGQVGVTQPVLKSGRVSYSKLTKVKAERALISCFECLKELNTMGKGNNYIK